MTVAELIKKLSEIDQSLTVMIFDEYRSYYAEGEVWIDKDSSGVDHCYIS